MQPHFSDIQEVTSLCSSLLCLIYALGLCSLTLPFWGGKQSYFLSGWCTGMLKSVDKNLSFSKTVLLWQVESLFLFSQLCCSLKYWNAVSSQQIIRNINLCSTFATLLCHLHILEKHWALHTVLHREMWDLVNNQSCWKTIQLLPPWRIISQLSNWADVSVTFHVSYWMTCSYFFLLQNFFHLFFLVYKHIRAFISKDSLGLGTVQVQCKMNVSVLEAFWTVGNGGTVWWQGVNHRKKTRDLTLQK